MFTRSLSHIDKICVGTLALLMCLIFVLVLRGDRTFLVVKSFNLENTTISPQDVQLLFEFNKEVDKKSLQDGIEITPDINGKLSFIGKKIAFTASEKLDYGQTYTVTLKNITDTRGKPLRREEKYSFITENKKLFYIGVEGIEMGRIVLYDTVTNEKKIMSPSDIYVLSYAPLHLSEKIIFSGVRASDIDKGRDPHESIGAYIQIFEYDMNSYSTTIIASNEKFYNYGFKVSDDDIIVLNRALIPDKKQPGSRPRLYIKNPLDIDFQRFWNTDMVGEPVFFGPDGSSILGIDAKKGFIINAIENGKNAQQLIGNYFNTYGFNTDGSKILFTQNDRAETGKAQSILDPTNLLMYDENGNLGYIPHEKGIIRDAHFSPEKNNVYFTLLVDTDQNKKSKVFHLFKYLYEEKLLLPLFEYPTLSVENFTISDDEKYIVAEISQENERTDADLYDILLPYFESIGDFYTRPKSSPYILLIDLQTDKKTQIPLYGKQPQWK